MLAFPLRFFLLFMASLATGCGQGSTVHVAEKFSPGNSLLTSADVRSINRTKGKYSRGRMVPEYVTCAEPSPDIAKAVSESFNFGGSFGITGLPSGISPEAAAAISLARAEGVAQLTQRLATIQLLRDGLYRACEAYANGAMSDTTYAVILSRFDDTMVTMLMGELAAGNFSGRLAAIGTGGGGGSSASLSEAVRELVENAEQLTNSVDPQTTQTDEGDDSAAPQTVKQVNESNRNAAKAAFANSLAQVTQIVAAESSGFRQDPEIAKTIGTMQRKFIENVNMDAMVVACVSALDTGRLDGNAAETWARLKVAKTAFKLKPNDKVTKAAYEKAALDHATLMADGVTSPLAAQCATQILPDVADFSKEVLAHILETSRAEKQAYLERDAQLVHINAMYDYLEKAKIRELRYDALPATYEKLKNEIALVSQAAESTRSEAEEQRKALDRLVAETRRLDNEASHAAFAAKLSEDQHERLVAAAAAIKSRCDVAEKLAVDAGKAAADKADQPSLIDEATRRRATANDCGVSHAVAESDANKAATEATKLRTEASLARDAAAQAKETEDIARRTWRDLNEKAIVQENKLRILMRKV